MNAAFFRTSFRTRDPQRSVTRSGPLALLLACSVLLLALDALVAHPASAQTLARPGWAGSGLTVERWWKHAVIVDLRDPAASATPDRLDTLRTLGVDAILLRGVALPTAATPNPDTPHPDPLDDLLREASRRGIRVLVELPAGQPGALPPAQPAADRATSSPSAANLAAAARSWAARGAAGFLLNSGTPDDFRSVRSAVRAVPGDRILIGSSATDASAEAPAGHRPGPEFSADLRLTPVAGLTPQPDPTQLNASLAALLAQAPAMLLSPEAPASSAMPPGLTRVAAAVVLLSTPGASLIEENWLRPADSFSSATAANATAASTRSPFDQLRQFTALHHDRPAFRDGPSTFLDHTPEGAVVWLRRGPTGSTFVVACNLRATPLRLSLTDDLAPLHLRGAFLRTLSRSDPGLGAMPLNALTLPPFGVYIGELSR